MSRKLVSVKFRKLNPNAKVPVLGTPEAACVDLVATEIDYVDESKVIVKYGFATEIPPGYKVLLMPRSSFAHKGWTVVHNPGVIDSDYRGEWMTKFDAIPQGVDSQGIYGSQLLYTDFPYKVGDRVVQAMLEVSTGIQFENTEELSTTLRGEGGFGSTGN